jgi:hypothetical protein
MVVRLDTSAPKPGAATTEDDATPLPKPLEEMTKPELLEYAAKEGISVLPSWPVSKLRDEIAHAGAAAE